jgi:hypothetical protein
MATDLEKKISDALFSYMNCSLDLKNPKGEKIRVEWEGNTLKLTANGRDYNPFKGCMITEDIWGEKFYNGKRFAHCFEEFMCEGLIAKAEDEDDLERIEITDFIGYENPRKTHVKPRKTKKTKEKHHVKAKKRIITPSKKSST